MSHCNFYEMRSTQFLIGRKCLTFYLIAKIAQYQAYPWNLLPMLFALMSQPFSFEKLYFIL